MTVQRPIIMCLSSCCHLELNAERCTSCQAKSHVRVFDLASIPCVRARVTQFKCVADALQFVVDPVLIRLDSGPHTTGDSDNTHAYRNQFPLDLMWD
jgi:hypothetical protein